VWAGLCHDGMHQFGDKMGESYIHISEDIVLFLPTQDDDHGEYNNNRTTPFTFDGIQQAWDRKSVLPDRVQTDDSERAAAFDPFT
jgi:hypothetical protein